MFPRIAGALVLILSVTALPAFAIGIYGGTTYASIEATLEYEGLAIDLNAGRGAGAQLGAFGELGLSRRLALRLGFAWNRYHSTAHYAESDSDGAFSWDVSVEGDNDAAGFSLPVDLIARPLLFHPQWFLSAGASVLSPSSARMQGWGEAEIYYNDSRLETISEDLDEDYESYLKDWVVLYGAGVGRDFELLGVQSFAWLRYERSLDDWTDEKGYSVWVQGLVLFVGVRL